MVFWGENQSLFLCRVCCGEQVTLSDARKLFFDEEQPAVFQDATNTLHVWIAHREQLTAAVGSKVTQCGRLDACLICSTRGVWCGVVWWRVCFIVLCFLWSVTQIIADLSRGLQKAAEIRMVTQLETDARCDCE